MFKVSQPQVAAKLTPLCTVRNARHAVGHPSLSASPCLGALARTIIRVQHPMLGCLHGPEGTTNNIRVLLISLFFACASWAVFTKQAPLKLPLFFCVLRTSSRNYCPVGCKCLCPLTLHASNIMCYLLVLANCCVFKTSSLCLLRSLDLL